MLGVGKCNVFCLGFLNIQLINCLARFSWFWEGHFTAMILKRTFCK